MNLKSTGSQFFLAILVTAITVYFIVSVWKMSSNTERFVQHEGFAGPAKGAGIPDCLRDSQEASDIYEQFATKTNMSEEGPDDLRELTLILSKLCCFAWITPCCWLIEQKYIWLERQSPSNFQSL